jgi:methylaspartate ammonia-lyase
LQHFILTLLRLFVSWEAHRGWSVVADIQTPVIGVDLLSHFGLIVDCRNNRLLDGVTSLSTPAQDANSLMLSIKTISSGTAVNGLLAEFPDLTRPTGAQHNTTQHRSPH